MKTISILGCGWLGFPLAKKLLEQNYAVKGSTTTPEKLINLTNAGVQAFHLNFSPTINADKNDAFFDTDCLIISIPPKLRWREPSFHVQQIQSLIEILQEVELKKIIFISSTSVYPELNRDVFEVDVSQPAQAASPVLVEVENLLQTHFGEKLLVLRCGGLMGYDRIPAKYFAGWKGLTTGNIPVNFIHQDDVIGIILHCLKNDIVGIFNAIAPQHPIRKDIYLKNCKQFGFELPEFVDAPPQPFKTVNSKKIQDIGYIFKYENPLDFFE